MDSRELDYVDFRDVDALRNYVDNAPTPMEGTPLEPVASDIFVMPAQPRRPRGRPRKNMNVTPPRQKRSYVRITNQQRNDLVLAFREFGDDKPPEWYSCKFGITLHNVANLLVKLRRGESIMPKGYYNRKSRVVPFQHLVRREIELDATVPMWQVRKDLEAVVARYGSDVESLAPDVVDDIVRARNERGLAAGGGDVHADDSHGTADTDDIDTLNDTLNGTDDVDMLDDDTHSRPAVQIPSVSSLNAFLRGDSGMDILRDIPVFTMKRETVRGAHANTPENKELRYQAVVALRRMTSGYPWVCLDETSWVIGSTPVYGRSERGKKCFITKGRGGLRLTSVAAVDVSGVSYCNVTTGTNTAETFNAYLRRLVSRYDERGVRCVFWCDNCSIHNGIAALLEGSRHCVVFNAAYSPELNPIEHFFGLWKGRAERDVREWHSLQGFLNAISHAFTSIESSTVTSFMEHCRTDVWRSVIAREDL